MILVTGKYPDGSTVDLSRSTRTKYGAMPRGIVSVSMDGYVSALAAGSATILVEHQQQKTAVRVVVTPSVK